MLVEWVLDVADPIERCIRDGRKVAMAVINVEQFSLSVEGRSCCVAATGKSEPDLPRSAGPSVASVRSRLPPRYPVSDSLRRPNWAR